MEQQQCQNCDQKHNCQEVYKQLGQSTAPSVLTKVILAFLLPLVLFIFSIVMAERLLIEKLKSDATRNLAVFALAIAVVFLYLIVLKLWRRNN